MKFYIDKLIKDLSNKRKLFVSEADFQLELAWLIKEQYPDAKVRLEYCPQFNPSMHIDILVIINEQWIPIELKYKTKGCKKLIDNEYYDLKNHSAKDINCYAYLKDIKRIEFVKENVDTFKEGYAILLTNELSYMKTPTSKDVNYYEFSIHEGSIKHGVLDWNKNTSEGTKGRWCKNPIVLSGEYKMKWNNYSKIDETPTGCFKVLINKII